MNNIICHIAGLSGSGKTTLIKRIAQEFVDRVIAIDLDQFDTAGSFVLGLDSTQKKSWKDEDFAALANIRQRLMNDAIASSSLPLVLGGHHREGSHVLDIPTEHRFLLDVDAHTAAMNAYERSQHEQVEHRRSLEDVPFDEKEAQEEIDFLLSNGYQKKSTNEIVQFIKSNL